MKIKPIRTEEDYTQALARIDSLMDAEFGSADGDELDVLVTLIEAYERHHFPIEAPDPVEFIKNAMDLLGKEQKVLAEVLRSRSRASEILNRQRRLTLAQIRCITAAWSLPSDPLIAEYEITNEKPAAQHDNHAA